MSIYINRVITVFSRKTSLRLTAAEWNILDTICLKEHLKRKHLLELIEQQRDKSLCFTAAVRLFSLLYLSAVADKVLNSYFPVSYNLPDFNRILSAISSNHDNSSFSQPH